MPLQWVSKDMIIGNYVANALHLFQVREHMDAEEVRGLRVSDLKRDDRQNFAAVVRRSSNLVRDRLQRMQRQAPTAIATQGTVAVYGMIHQYLLLFFSLKSTLADRFDYGGYVCHFLRLWRVSIKFWHNKQERNLDKCFYPNQTFRHILMSVQSACTFILICAILCPNAECCLRFLGSDCCEKLFAMVGGWGLITSWQRCFCYAQILKKITDSNALFLIAAQGNVWQQTHRSDKCEFDAKTHEDSALPDADLSDYPSPDVAAERWRQGMQRAERDCIRLGMRHEDIPQLFWEKPWLDDPPNPDTVVHPYDEYLSRKEARDDTDSDYEPNTSSDSTDSESSTSFDSDDDGEGESDDDPDNDEEIPLAQQLDHAIHHLHDAANPGHPRRMIVTPSGKLISKTTAVNMLRECFDGGRNLSKDRLRRIEQCATSANTCTEQLVEHDDAHLELFQDVALAFDAGPGTDLHVEFGRIQKMVSRGMGKSKKSYLRLYAIPFDNVPDSLEVRLHFYNKVGHHRGMQTFKYETKPDVKRYSASATLKIVHFDYDAESDVYTLPQEQWTDISEELTRLQTERGTNARRARTRRRVRTSDDNPYKRATYRTPNTRRGRSARGMDVNGQTGAGRALQVGMKVRLYHEVRSSHACVHLLDDDILITYCRIPMCVHRIVFTESDGDLAKWSIGERL